MGLPVEVNNLMLGSLGGYTVGRSLRFRASASAYLSRTPASASNRTTWTISIWLKRGALTSADVLELFSAASNGQNITRCFFDNSTNQLYFRNVIGNVNTANFATTQVFRDPSAWYHLIIVWDSSQATSTNRVKIYINGTQITAFSSATYPAQNENSWWNAVYTHNISNNPTANRPFDGYLAEVNFIDGQALTPSSFGAYDTNGVWQPKKYSGTYGTNGFYLPFSNTTSTTTLVQDSSGNGNNWTPNNISLTAGYTYDSMLDSPTNAAGTSTGIGNYCIVMPNAGAGGSITNGNLTISGLANQADQRRGSLAVSSGKWYYEINLPTLGSAGIMWGVIETSAPYSAALYGSAFAYQAFTYSGISFIQKHNNSTANTNLTPAGAGDVLQLAIDLDNNKIWFGKNNTWADSGNPSTGANTTFTVTAGTYVPAFRPSDGTTAYSMEVNCGQRPFTYTPPSGFKALNTYNLPAPSIANGAQYMAATLYTGTGATQSISNAVNGVSFQPDFVWIKNRNNNAYHWLTDSVRGITNYLSSNDTIADQSASDAVTALNSNGFTLGVNTSGTYTTGGMNYNGRTFVGWQWKGGGTGVTNTSGTITSTVSASPSSGFSIATYTGNGTAGATVGHGLGVTPAMVIMKSRTLTGSAPTSQWLVWHQSISQALHSSSTIQLNGFTGALYFNLTNASSTYGMDAQINGSGQTYVAYCFSAVRGFSAFGSYTGNGSSTDGPFVYTGFRPRWIMVKATGEAGGWTIMDTARLGYNASNYTLYAEATTVEQGYLPIDILSNGFKIRLLSTGTSFNTNSINYIYAAFAENPFNYSRAR